MLLSESKIVDCNDIELLVSLENQIFDEQTREERSDLEERLHLAKILYVNEKPAGYYLIENNYLYAIGLIPEFRGQGLGEFLMRSAMSDVNGPMSLHVLETNEIAIAMYRKYGFTIYNIEKDFYAEGLHAIFMKRK